MTGTWATVNGVLLAVTIAYLLYVLWRFSRIMPTNMARRADKAEQQGDYSIELLERIEENTRGGERMSDTENTSSEPSEVETDAEPMADESNTVEPGNGETTTGDENLDQPVETETQSE